MEERRLLVLQGRLVEGEVRPGMHIRVALNSALSVTARIDAVESVPSEEPGTTNLSIGCDEDELELWQTLDLVDETIEVSAPHLPTSDSE